MSLNQLVWHNIINVIPRVTIQSLIQSTLIYKVTNKSSGTAQDKYCVQDTHVDVPEVKKQKQSENWLSPFDFTKSLRSIFNKVTFSFTDNFITVIKKIVKNLQRSVRKMNEFKLEKTRKSIWSNEVRGGYGFIQDLMKYYFGIRILSGLKKEFSNM